MPVTSSMVSRRNVAKWTDQDRKELNDLLSQALSLLKGKSK